MSSKDYRVLAGMTAIWLVMMAAVDPSGAFPLNDDWSYIEMLTNLTEGHRILPTDVTIMSLVGQIVWAAPFVWLSGSVFMGARLSTMVLGLAAPVAMFIGLRQLGTSTTRSTLAALAVMTNPLWVLLSCTFMTDVPFAAVAMCAVVLVIGARQSGRTSVYAAAVACLVWATLIRQVGLFFALGAVVVLWPPQRSAPAIARACAPLVVCAAALAGYSWWLGHTVGLPEMYQQRNVQALIDMFHIRSHAKGVAMGVLAASLYTGWALIPILPLTVAAGLRTANPRRWDAVLAGVAGFAFVVVLVLHKTLPVTGNMIGLSGLGALTLPGSQTLPALPPLVPAVITLLAIVSGLYAVRAMWLAWHATANDLFVRVLGFMLVTGACYVAAISQIWVYDRHVVPLMLLTILGGVAAGGQASLPRWAVGAAVVLIAANALVGVLGTRDYFAWNAARWSALDDLARQGVPPAQIDGGAEYNGPMAYDPDRPLGTAGWWQPTGVAYRVAFAPEPGWSVVARYEYHTLLPPSRRSLVVLNK